MTTVGEKSSDVATLLDDIANILTNLGGWSDADTDVTNDQTNNNYKNNGRVLKHADTTIYLLMYISNGFSSPNNNEVSGIRFLYSNDWDTGANQPNGKSNQDDNDRPNGGINRENSFTNTYINNNNSGMGLWFKTRQLNIDDVATSQINYFVSGRNDGLTVGAWDTADSNYGGVGWINWEYVDNKFWSDGEPSVATAYQLITPNNNREGGALYSFNSIGLSKQAVKVGNNQSAVNHSRWGKVNPDSNDDTFFFRRPVIYETLSRNNPVAYMEDAIPNDKNSGGAHGDTITHDGDAYKILKQSGASKSKTLTVGLRFN